MAKMRLGESATPTVSFVLLGTFDDYGTMYHFPGIDKDAAEAVFSGAQELMNLRDSGALPNLAPNLTTIINPNHLESSQ